MGGSPFRFLCLRWRAVLLMQEMEAMQADRTKMQSLMQQCAEMLTQMQAMQAQLRVFRQ